MKKETKIVALTWYNILYTA